MKRGGIVWGGYIDDAETAEMLAACDYGVHQTRDKKNCDSERAEVEVIVVAEKVWFKGLGIPKSNMKRNPRSIIWRKY